MLTYEVKNYLIVDKSEENLVFIYFCLVAYLTCLVYLIKKEMRWYQQLWHVFQNVAYYNTKITFILTNSIGGKS